MKRARRFAALAAAAGFLFCACGPGRFTGGFDDAENPAIRVALADADGRPYGAATLNVYARYQNPYRDSLPILSFPASADSAVLTDTALQSAFLRAQAAGTPSPSRDTLEFNLIATAPGGEAFLGGFALIRRSAGWGFIRKADGAVRYPDANGVLAAEARLLAPILGQRGQIGPRGLELGLKRLFVPGSPYASELAADGSFSLARIAAGRYELKAMAEDEKVFTAADSLEAGAAYPGSEWSEAEVIWVVP